MPKNGSNLPLFTISLRLPSQLQSITAFWQYQMGVNNLPRVVT